MRPRLVQYIVCMVLFCTGGICYGQQGRRVPDSVVRAMKNAKEYRYANDPAFWQKEKPINNSALLRILSFLSGSTLFRRMLYFILLTFLIYVVYQVAVVNNFFIFSRSGNKTNNERIEDKSIPDNIDDRIDAAIAQGELRLAIRFYYLKTLALLNSGNKIHLHAESTNDEYIIQMSGHLNVNDFRRLTNIYEYVWYGEFKPDTVQFEKIRASFNQFNASI